MKVFPSPQFILGHTCFAAKLSVLHSIKFLETVKVFIELAKMNSIRIVVFFLIQLSRLDNNQLKYWGKLDVFFFNKFHISAVLETPCLIYTFSSQTKRMVNFNNSSNKCGKYSVISDVITGLLKKLRFWNQSIKFYNFLWIVLNVRFSKYSVKLKILFWDGYIFSLLWLLFDNLPNIKYSNL